MTRTVYHRLPLDITPRMTVDEAAAAVLAARTDAERLRAAARNSEINNALRGGFPTVCRPADRNWILAEPVDLAALDAAAIRWRDASKAAESAAKAAADAVLRRDMTGPLFRNYDPDPLNRDDNEPFDSKTATAYIRNIRDGIYSGDVQPARGRPARTWDVL